MFLQVFEDLYAFLWDDLTQNNCNTYLINANKKILIDPGHQHLFAHLIKELSHVNLSLEDIDLVLVTHGHPDHVGGVTSLAPSTQFALAAKEYRFMQSVSRYAITRQPDFLLSPGALTCGEILLECIETPGHSPGSLCLYWPERKTLLSGDLLFNQGIGRTDLPGGNSQELKDSIMKVRALDIEMVLCGHGDIVAGKEAVQKNFSFITQVLFQYL
jgi:glyoxylase-like metal-dependent hydrolase (beta-lactamase superfamily II)